MLRMILFVLLWGILIIPSLSSVPLDLWKAPLGASYEECLRIWASQDIIPDLKADGPAFSRKSEESLVFFRYKHYQGFVAQDIQAVFSQGLLTKVRVVYRRGQNPQSYFDSYFRELKKYYDRTFFPSNRSLGFVKTGAAWIFPEGETIYMGSVIPTDLVVILDGRNTSSTQSSEGLFPRPE